MSTNKGWIGVDLDGTLAHYDGWQGIGHIGAPIAPMVERVKRWLAAGENVKIFTARVDGGEVAIGMGDQNGVAHRDIPLVRAYIEAWCVEHIGVVLPVTNVKDYGMIELYDDRAVQVIANTGTLVGGSTRGLDDPPPAPDPVVLRARAPVVPDDIRTDAALDETPLGRARFLRDRPDVTESHAACRQVINGLLAELEARA
jgi:hypothetical protein